MERRSRQDRRKNAVTVGAVAALLLALALPPIAQAALGQMAESTDVDRQKLHARKSVRPGAAFAVHELALPSGTLVREYVAPDNRVFAVAWRGPTLPDLQQIFGEENLQTFLSAPPEHRTRRRSRTVREPGLVVHSSGRARFFTGFAYVPSLLPPTVREEDIR